MAAKPMSTCGVAPSKRLQGVALMLLGVSLVAPDSVLVRFLAEEGTLSWPIVFCKQFVCCVTVSIYAVASAGGPRSLLRGLAGDPWSLLALGTLVQMGLSMTVTLSLFYTTAARALLFLSLSTFWSSLLGWFVLGDALSHQTGCALVTAFTALCLILWPDAGVEDSMAGAVGRPSVLGDVLGIASGMLLAGFITLCRLTSLRAPGANLAVCAAVGSGLAALVALLASRGSWHHAVNGYSGESETWYFYAAVLADGFGEGAYFVCVSIAPGLITGAEVAMLSLLEIVLGPLYVFLAYGDAPHVMEAIGGVLLLITVAVHEVVMPSAEDTLPDKEQQWQSTQIQASGDLENAMRTVVADAHSDRDVEAIFNFVPRAPITAGSSASALSHVAMKRRVRNARASGFWTLARNGFTLVQHRTKVNFDVLDEVSGTYYTEMEALAMQHIPSAERCVVFDHKVRRTGEHDLCATPAPPAGFRAYAPGEAPPVNQSAGYMGGEYGSVFNPNHVVHGDYTGEGAEARVRALSQLPGYGSSEPPLSASDVDDLLQGRRRFMFVNVWRSISREHPVRRSPLGLVDCATVNDKSDLYGWVQRGPQDTGVFDGFSNGRIEDHVELSVGLDPDSDHRWYYFPDMDFEEALVFKTYDSATSEEVDADQCEKLARFTIHSAFADPATRPEDPMRESIDTRLLVIFPPAEAAAFTHP